MKMDSDQSAPTPAPRVRTRFAPSPTGYLHLGGARAAIYNWLHARGSGGAFILRIEDTDRERSTSESVEQILASLEWLGLEYDEGPYFQSERLDLYKENLDRLLESGRAYRCVCSPEELETKRAKALTEGRKPKYDYTCRDRGLSASTTEPYVIRLAAEREGVTSFTDLLRGEISCANDELDDFIIARSDGSPTYNFVVTIDDALMGITHVIRGDDHISNTPKQVMLYGAFGFEVPAFAHAPMILGSDGKRFSKRHGAADAREMRSRGILPEALFNYLARLGWGSGDRELIRRAELKEIFKLSDVSLGAARFDYEKLLWLNGEYMKIYDTPQLRPEFDRIFKEDRALKSIDDKTSARIDAAIPALKSRAKTMLELLESSRPFLSDEIEIDDELARKIFPDPKSSAELLNSLGALLGGLEKFDEESVEGLFKEFLARRKIKMKAIAQPARLALTGRTVSPGIYEVIALLGRSRALSRLRDCAEYLENRMERQRAPMGKGGRSR